MKPQPRLMCYLYHNFFFGAIAEYPAAREHKLLATTVPRCRGAVVDE